MSQPVIVIGAGLTGLSVARALGPRCLVLEREGEPGGLARTRRRDGFAFDYTGHWLHLRSPRARALVDGLGIQWLQVERRSRGFAYGVETPYPFQLHLHGHRPERIHACLVGLWRARTVRYRRRPRSFREFLYATFGDGIVESFLGPYNEKLWGVGLEELTAEWCGRFVPVPDVEQVLAGALGVSREQVGYNVTFSYPARGGIQHLSQALAESLPDGLVRYGAQVEAVDWRRRRVRVGDEWLEYETLVSTMPLPALCRILVAPPRRVVAWAEALRATPVVYLDVAARIRKDYHWVYVPEHRYPFYRVGIYSNVAPAMAPPGLASLYVELASRDVSTPLEDLGRQVAAGLTALGLLARPSDLLWLDRHVLDPAYVVYDRNWRRARSNLLRFLQRHGIRSAGRYGSWVYNSMEDSILEGLTLGEELARSAGGDHAGQ